MMLSRRVMWLALIFTVMFGMGQNAKITGKGDAFPGKKGPRKAARISWLLPELGTERNWDIFVRYFALS